MAKGAKPRTLRFLLVTLVFASVVPMLIFAVIMGVLFEKQELAALERGRRDTARALSVAVDRELSASISTLQALATSEHLDTGELKAFYGLAQRVLKAHPGWNTINLIDLSGQQLINLLRPFGAPLPNSRDLPVIRRALDTGELAISDVFVGPVSAAPIIGITVPVTRGGHLKYVLSAGLDVTSLSRLLSESKIPAEWVATIIDRKGTILARSQGIEEWLGKPAPAAFVTQSQQSEEGSLSTVTIDGVSVYQAYSRSRLSGWTVGLAVPVAVVEAPGRSSLLVVTAGGVVFLLLAGGLATVLGRRIARGIGSLSASARALAQGEIPSPAGGSTISEVDHVARQMADAARARADAIAARLKAEAALGQMAAIVESSADAIIGKTLDGTIVSWNRGAETLYGYSAGEIAGRPISVLVPRDRSGEIPALLERLRRGEGIEHFETVRIRQDGTRVDVSLTVSPIKDGVGMIKGASSIARDISQRTRAEETAQALAEVGRDLAGTLNVDEAAGKVVRSLVALFKARRATLFQLEHGSGALVCVAAAGESDQAKWVGQRLAAGEGPVGRAVAEGRPVRFSDQLDDPRVVLPAWVREQIRESQFVAVAAVPLRARGEVIGALAIADSRGRVFTEEEAGLLSAFGDQAALALQNARLYSESDRRRREAEALAEVGRTISQSLDVTEVAQRIADSVRTLFHAENAAVFRLERDTEDLATVAGSGDVGPAAPESVTFPKGTGVVGLAVRTRQVVHTDDLLADHRVTLTPAARARIGQAPYRAVLAAPLTVMGQVIGALGIGVRLGRVFTTEEVRLIEAFATHAATALENARLYQQTEQAYEDLKRTQDQLTQAQKMESIGRLAGGIAHDFNNLLTVIAGRAVIATGRLGPGSPVERDLGAIGEASKRASALTRQLLA